MDAFGLSRVRCDEHDARIRRNCVCPLHVKTGLLCPAQSRAVHAVVRRRRAIWVDDLDDRSRQTKGIAKPVEIMLNCRACRTHLQSQSSDPCRSCLRRAAHPLHTLHKYPTSYSSGKPSSVDCHPDPHRRTVQRPAFDCHPAQGQSAEGTLIGGSARRVTRLRNSGRRQHQHQRAAGIIASKSFFIVLLDEEWFDVRMGL